jgi:hypothetical protein
MNLTYKKPLLYAAVVAALGLVPISVALAASASYSPRGVTPGSEDDAIPIYIPAEAKESASVYYNAYDTTVDNTAQISATSGDLSAYIYTVPAYAIKPGEQKSLTVKVSLTGGAKFVTAPVLICAHSGVDVAADITNITWDGGFEPADQVTADDTKTDGSTAYYLAAISQAVGLASYSFAFPGGFTIPEDNSGACILSISAGVPYGTNSLTTDTKPGAVSAVKGVAGTEVNLVSEVTYNEFYSAITKTASIPFISFVTAFKTEVSATNLGSDATTQTAIDTVIDVALLSKKFYDHEASTKNSYVGYVIVTAADPDKYVRDASGNQMTAALMIGSAMVTLSGPTVAGISKVYLSQSDVESCEDGAELIKASPSVSTVSGSSVSVGSVTFTVTGSDTLSDGYKALISDTTDDKSDGHVGVAVCLVADGLTPMSDGYLSISILGSTLSGKEIELGNAPDYYQVQRNGTSIRVLSVPLSKDDPNKVNIRMFNTSNQEVSGVKGIIYSTSGAVLKDDVDLGTIPAYGLKLLTSDAVRGMLSTEQTGRAWMVIQAPVRDSFKVQVLMKHPNGVLSNISTDAID